MAALEWQVAAITDGGCKRSENQDNFYISPDQRVFVVADGMGGELGGATASKLAVEAVEQLWKSSPPNTGDKESIQQWLVEAVSNANHSVFSVSNNDPTVQGMGTTIVVAVQSDDYHLYIAHVGDSRAYMIREGKTIVLTQDHSVVMDLLLAGRISAEQFRTSPFRNYITRCVGHNHKVEIDRTPVEVKANDRVIICSDGLPTVLQDENIGEVVQQHEDPEEVCKELLKKTLDGGAPDNVTIVTIRYQSESKKKSQELVKKK
jgi:PPM family protein phosphatase